MAVKGIFTLHKILEVKINILSAFHISVAPSPFHCPMDCAAYSPAATRILSAKAPSRKVFTAINPMALAEVSQPSTACQGCPVPCAKVAVCYSIPAKPRQGGRTWARTSSVSLFSPSLVPRPRLLAPTRQPAPAPVSESSEGSRGSLQ